MGRFLAYGTLEKPLLLTNAIIPTGEDYHRANTLFSHLRGCRCSTCALAADLGCIVRGQQKDALGHSPELAVKAECSTS